MGGNNRRFNYPIVRVANANMTTLIIGNNDNKNNNNSNNINNNNNDNNNIKFNNNILFDGNYLRM